jgi:hypothetical protein
MLTKIATLQYDQAHVYKILTNIDKYSMVSQLNLIFVLIIRTFLFSAFSGIQMWLVLNMFN